MSSERLHNAWRAAAIAALVSLSTIVVVAQASRPATQTIRGRIIADETEQPLTNVGVRIRDTAVVVRTDLEGRFTITAPAPAVLVVTKAGYVRREIERAVPPEIRLTRSAAIAGRVTNDRGEPVPGVVVAAATRYTLDAPIRNLPTATTDDRGEYRIGGLAPGRYTASARSAGGRVVGFNLPNGGVAFGPAQFVSYFPDVADSVDAMPVSLDAGDERADIDFHIAASNTDVSGDALAVMLARMTAETQARSIKGVTGTAAVRGTVVSSDGRPLPQAVVAIFQQGPRLFARTTTTDTAGAYQLNDLPAGTYHVTAALPGFSMPTDAPPLGYEVLAGAGPEITLTESADQSVDVTMLRWGSISGRIVDETGEPIQGALVGVMVTRYQDGRRRLVVASPQARTTDDRGAFRIFGVPAGQYVLGASVGDALSVDLPGYVPTYFPGTDVAATAQFISVDPGEDVGGVDVPLVAATTAGIRGRVVDASGRPWSQMFVLVPRSPIAARIGARLEADGTFEFRNVAPGRYVIQAERGRQGSAVEGEFLAHEVTVGNGDITNLRIQTSVGSRVGGHVTFESVTNALPPAPTSVSLSPIPVDFDLAPRGIATTDPDKNYAFELRGISGARRLQVTKLPSGWGVKAILSNGRNITDEVLQFGRANQSLDDVEVVLTERINEIAGTVSDARGRRAEPTRVIAFSIDREQWYPASRFVRSAMTSGEGSYSVTGLPTGSYFVAVVLRTPPGEGAWSDPVFLDSIRGSAKVVTLGDGQKQALNLQIPPR